MQARTYPPVWVRTNKPQVRPAEQE